MYNVSLKDLGLNTIARYNFRLVWSRPSSTMTDQVVGGSVAFCLIHCKLITQPNHDVVDKSEHRIEGKNNLLGVWQVPAD